GESFLLEGRRFKVIRGMGSLGAMEEGSADRYFQEGEVSPSKLVPEGIEGRVPYKGPVADVIFQMAGGLRSGMGYCGVCDIKALPSRSPGHPTLPVRENERSSSRSLMRPVWSGSAACGTSQIS